MTHLIFFNFVAAKRLTLIAFFLLAVNSLVAQTGDLLNSVTASYTSSRLQPGYQYLGLGADYRFMYRSWLGFEGQVEQSNQIQLTSNYIGGYQIGQIDGAILAGHRWGNETLLGEVGFGVIRTDASGGVNQTGSLTVARNYPDLILGGLLDVLLSRRWSLIYEVRDNLAFIQPLLVQGFINVQTPAAKVNVPRPA